MIVEVFSALDVLDDLDYIVGEIGDVKCLIQQHANDPKEIAKVLRSLARNIRSTLEDHANRADLA